MNEEAGGLTPAVIEHAVRILQTGGIIAYPTEAVFGLGCDPRNESAIARLCELKGRSLTKGLILVAANYEMLADYVDDIPDDRLQSIQKTWPGPYTWCFPASATASKSITGAHSSIAVRVSAHPVVQHLSLSINCPIVSTSANLQGQPPAKSAATVEKFFKDAIDYIVPGNVGSEQKPTEIRDALTNALIRGA